MKALNLKSVAFKYLFEFFPKLSEAKIRGGILVGPQIKKALESTEYSMFSRIEIFARNCFIAVVKGFLSNHKAENYKQIVQDLLKTIGVIGFRMSPKLHMLDIHLKKFKNKIDAYIEDQGERFQHDVKGIEGGGGTEATTIRK